MLSSGGAILELPDEKLHRGKISLCLLIFSGLIKVSTVLAVGLCTRITCGSGMRMSVGESSTALVILN